MKTNRIYVHDPSTAEPLKLPPGTLTEGDLGQPMDLTDAEGVRWFMRVNGGEVQEIDVETDRETSRFTLPPLDVSKPGTTYDFEAEISWGEGQIETVPNTGYLTFEVKHVEEIETEVNAGAPMTEEEHPDRIMAMELVRELTTTLRYLAELGDVVPVLEALTDDLRHGPDENRVARVLREFGK